MPVMVQLVPDLAAAATAADAAASAAASAAGVVVREVDDVPTLGEVSALLTAIWGEEGDEPAVSVHVLRALAHTGNYVTVAERGDDMLGACVGFFGVADGWELHSHIAGVSAAARGRSVGFALKVHQRAWALAHGLDRISWTFDPLVRRNAALNLTKLAARPRAYLPAFYGPMTDAINAGDESDRMVLEWRLLDDAVVRACHGQSDDADVEALLAAGAAVGLSSDASGGPVLGSVDAETVLVAVPADVERLRADDLPAALAWRHAVREVLGGMLEAGDTVSGFARSGWYVVRRA